MNREAHLFFDCFGGTASVHVLGLEERDGTRRAEAARRTLLDAHRRLTRFDPESELCKLNRDPREEVPASPLLRRLAEAVRLAGERSGGLVDATLVGELEQAGYGASLHEGGAGSAPERPGSTADAHGEGASAPARPHPSARWREVRVDEEAGTIVRPPGVRIDGGGLAKGLLADLLAARLEPARSFAVDCCGDLRLGGGAGLERAVVVEDPRGQEPLHTFRLARGAVATSGTGRRAWIRPDGRPAHHIIDPASGEPARTGLVQATALAPTALLAEILAKSALLAGPAGARERLPHGGILLGADGGVEVVPPHSRARTALRAAA